MTTTEIAQQHPKFRELVQRDLVTELIPTFLVTKE